MPNRCGSGTCFSRIWAAGGAGARERASSKRVDERVRRSCCEQVVAQVHHEVVVAQELAGDEHAVGQAERGVLGDVGDLDAEGAAVADGGHHLVARCRPR